MDIAGRGQLASGRGERSPGHIAGQPRTYKKRISPRYNE